MPLISRQEALGWLTGRYNEQRFGSIRGTRPHDVGEHALRDRVVVIECRSLRRVLAIRSPRKDFLADLIRKKDLARDDLIAPHEDFEVNVRCATAVQLGKIVRNSTFPAASVNWVPRRYCLPTATSGDTPPTPRCCGYPEYSPSASACQTSTRAFASVAQSPERTTCIASRNGTPGLPDVISERSRLRSR